EGARQKTRKPPHQVDRSSDKRRTAVCQSLARTQRTWHVSSQPELPDRIDDKASDQLGIEICGLLRHAVTSAGYVPDGGRGCGVDQNGERRTVRLSAYRVERSHRIARVDNMLTSMDLLTGDAKTTAQHQFVQNSEIERTPGRGGGRMLSVELRHGLPASGLEAQEE